MSVVNRNLKLLDENEKLKKELVQLSKNTISINDVLTLMNRIIKLYDGVPLQLSTINEGGGIHSQLSHLLMRFFDKAQGLKSSRSK